MTMKTTASRVALLTCAALFLGTAPALAHDAGASRPSELFEPGAAYVGQDVDTSATRPALIEGLGEYGLPVTTAEPLARAYFNQGVGMLWGFNHAEAVRAFRAAQEIDPTCAMCFWGEAYALGPNINDGMRQAAVERAWYAASLARILATTEKERALAEAMAARYAPGEDRAALNEAFADGMTAVSQRWPDDPDVLVVRADAVMNLQPWDYWEADGRTPKGRAGEIVEALERAMALSPKHPAALHLYIHAVEASADPGRAEEAADRLRDLAPAAGHLTHMPAHIYMRIGRHADSIAVNEAAIAADERYLAEAGAEASDVYRFGYYPHNVHFKLVSAQMAGLAEKGIEAARKLAGITSDEVSTEVAWVQAIQTAPYTAHAQLADPEATLALPPPAEDLPFVAGFRHYARGVAHAARGDLAAAEAERQAIAALIETTDLSGLEAQYLPASDLLAIAEAVVAARIARAEGDAEEALRLLEEAIALEDGISYMEPPYWYYPVRQTLGAVLLEQDRADEAAEAFRAALEQFPDNGWALWGLWQAEQARGDAEAASQAERAFRAAWLGDEGMPTLERL
ncbi:hypothetical protein [Salinarimonas sp.]|uniref:hypothetical protein n=1 Tax=Salinarimonas sp. TaxID=2766526 RepID=UPI0032D910FC